MSNSNLPSTRHDRHLRRPRRWAWLAAILVIAAAAGVAIGVVAQRNRTALPRIGATVTVVELTTGLPLEARVDTGAALTSIHCEEVEIDDEMPDPRDNIGRTLRCLLRNNPGETARLETRIVDHVGIRTTSQLDDRYIVELPIRVNGVDDRVWVSLNDRTEMQYPFLLGRNFLRGSFLVDVRRDRDRPPGGER